MSNLIEKGDIVYIPSIDGRWHMVEEATKEARKGLFKITINTPYPNSTVYFDKDGINGNGVQIAIPANENSYNALSNLYPNMSFNIPPEPPTTFQIIKSIVDKYGACLCSTELGNNLTKGLEFIVEAIEDSSIPNRGFYRNSGGVVFNYAIPLDSHGDRIKRVVK